MFIKYSEAPVTCLVVKNRVPARNPAGALYSSHSNYKRPAGKRDLRGYIHVRSNAVERQLFL
jgi:hypothetical protein